MDKKVFSAFKKSEEPNNLAFWKSKTISERLLAANYLNSIAYGYDVNDPPRLDKTKFEMIKR